MCLVWPDPASPKFEYLRADGNDLGLQRCKSGIERAGLGRSERIANLYPSRRGNNVGELLAILKRTSGEQGLLSSGIPEAFAPADIAPLANADRIDTRHFLSRRGRNGLLQRRIF